MDGCARARGSGRYAGDGGQELSRPAAWSSRTETQMDGVSHSLQDETCRQRRIPPRRQAKRRRTLLSSGAATVSYALLASSSVPATMAQSCIPLTDSTACSAFNASSISTNSDLAGLFPFLSDVTDTDSFDTQIQDYVASGFTQTKYEQLLGCNDVNLDNTTAFYARYTVSTLCNAIVQNSIEPCGLEGDATRPLCADSCAEYAQSEQEIVASDVCGIASSDALTQIRADFTNCALPADSLTGSCITAVTNEPDDCGFNLNLGSLCSYCSASSPNSTDSCCVYSNTESRCADVALPVIASSSLQQIVTTLTATATPSSTSPAAAGGAAPPSHRGLSGGQIAGIVVGSVLGALALLALIIFGCLLLRRRRSGSPATSVFNQPSTMRQVSPPPTSHAKATDGARDQERAGLAVLPGGRVARMSALEGSSSPSQNSQSPMIGAGGFRKSSSSDEAGRTPTHRGMMGPPRTGKRSGSLSSGSQLALAAMHEDTSPSTNDLYTSPESQNQSERLAFFKDYYSQDEIHPSDLVSALWAYEPRAPDEFHLDRGDMIKVIGIWDDGWATGVRVNQRADDWRHDDKVQRDSGMSNNGATSPDAEREGEVKAFPLVCVCLPQYWRQTIEGESTGGTGGY